MGSQAFNFELRVSQFIQLRNKKKEIADRHKEELAPVNEMLAKLEALLLQGLNQTGQDSAKTAAGTVYKTEQKSVSLEDPEEFMRHVIGQEAWELLDRKANKTAIADFVAENGAPPPGVKYSTMFEVGVRAPSKK
jgi:hypothetical protein